MFFNTVEHNALVNDRYVMLLDHGGRVIELDG